MPDLHEQKSLSSLSCSFISSSMSVSSSAHQDKPLLWTEFSVFPLIPLFSVFSLGLLLSFVKASSFPSRMETSQMHSSDPLLGQTLVISSAPLQLSAGNLCREPWPGARRPDSATALLYALKQVLASPRPSLCHPGTEHLLLSTKLIKVIH